MVCGILVGSTFLFLKFTGRLMPGPVSAMVRHGTALGGYDSHASFEKDCLHCHAPVHCLKADRCQACHLEIARQRIEGEGLHAQLPGTDRCQTCHPEHRGKDAVMTEVPLTNIDHATLTGFSLELHATGHDGAPVACEDCHKGGLFKAEAVDCVACHAAEDALVVSDHISRFGGECLLCHDGADRMLAFDHQTVFALDGAHAGAECEACHIDQAFAGMAGECEACHAEPDYHRGQFGTDCARCHGAVAWAPAQLTQHTFKMDHGGDPDVPCQTCHTESYTMHTCYGCHEHTPEEMLAVHAAAGVTEAAAPAAHHGAASAPAELAACATCHRTGAPEELAALRGSTTSSLLLAPGSASANQ